MLYAGPGPSLGRCMRCILLAWVCRLATRGLRVCSVSLGYDIQCCVCVILCLSTYAITFLASVGHVVGSVVLVAGASTVQCLAVLSASQCARGSLVCWTECLQHCPSASGVAARVSGVYVCTLVAVPFASKCATHQMWWWHIRVTVGRLWLRTLQSMTISTICCTCCSGGLVRWTS